MNGQELATAVQHGAKTIVLLLNNGMYGTIRMHQEREYPRHVAGTALRNPDFAALARAYGYAGVCIHRSTEFEAELLAALARRGDADRSDAGARADQHAGYAGGHYPGGAPALSRPWPAVRGHSVGLEMLFAIKSIAVYARPACRKPCFLCEIARRRSNA